MASVTASSILLLASLLVFQEVHCASIGFEYGGITVGFGWKRGLRGLNRRDESVQSTLFTAMDSDGDGFIDQTEFEAEHGKHDNQFADMLAQYDTDNDNLISESEFQNIPVNVV